MTTETLPAPVEVTTPIKPSEALRLGRLTRPVSIGDFLYDGENAACAIGAMAIGYGYTGPFAAEDLAEPYDIVRDELMMLGEAGGLVNVIWHVNDKAVANGQDGDAAVLAYLAERGL